MQFEEKVAARLASKVTSGAAGGTSPGTVPGTVLRVTPGMSIQSTIAAPKRNFFKHLCHIGSVWVRQALSGARSVALGTHFAPVSTSGASCLLFALFRRGELRRGLCGETSA